jgi:hypothetical protein
MRNDASALYCRRITKLTIGTKEVLVRVRAKLGRFMLTVFSSI